MGRERVGEVIMDMAVAFINITVHFGLWARKFVALLSITIP